MPRHNHRRPEMREIDPAALLMQPVPVPLRRRRRQFTLAPELVLPGTDITGAQVNAFACHGGARETVNESTATEGDRHDQDA